MAEDERTFKGNTAVPLQTLEEAHPALDKEAHHAALMEMLKDEWTPAHELILQEKKQRFLGEQLAQQGQEIAQNAPCQHPDFTTATLEY